MLRVNPCILPLVGKTFARPGSWEAGGRLIQRKIVQKLKFYRDGFITDLKRTSDRVNIGISLCYADRSLNHFAWN